jgi:hypothetical protein
VPNWVRQLGQTPFLSEPAIDRGRLLLASKNGEELAEFVPCPGSAAPVPITIHSDEFTDPA